MNAFLVNWYHINKDKTVPIKTQIEALLQEKMDRKDFLKYSGTVILGIIGVTGLVRMLVGSRGLSTGSTGSDTNSAKDAGGGYGSSAYGK